MKVYVAGPYSVGDQAVNVKTAISVAEELLNLGHTPFVPHLTHFWHMIYPHAYTTWIEYDLEWLEKCDALLRLEGESYGADKEVRFANAYNIPVYYSIQELQSRLVK